MKCYGNPPFCADVMLQVVQKVRMEKVDVVLVVPDWPGQAWYQELMFLPVTVVKLPTGTPLFASGRAGGEQLSPPPKWGVLAVHVNPLKAGYITSQPRMTRSLRGPSEYVAGPNILLDKELQLRCLQRRLRDSVG